MVDSTPVVGYPRLADVPGGSPEPTPGACAARRSQGPGYCLRAPMANGRCPMHGGKSLKGAESSSFVHGRYSKYIPTRLLARLEEAQSDPELLSLRSEIELIDARVADLLQRVESGESGATWKQLARHWKDFQRHRAANNTAKTEELLLLLAESIGQGLADHDCWTEIGQHLDRRARLVEQEEKRLEKMQQTLTIEQAMSMLGVVLDCLKRHVTDADILSAIGADLEQLVALDASTTLGARPRRRRV